MEKIIIAPSNVRGLGNVLDKDKDVALSNIYSENQVLGTETINGVEYRVGRINYQNKLLYFLDYHVRTTPGFLESVSAMVKDENEEVLKGVSVDLLDNNKVVASANSNDEGVVVFKNITFTEGVHELQLSYNLVKSGKINVVSINPTSLTGDDLWITRDKTGTILVKASNGDGVIPGIPVSVMMGDEFIVSYTDNTGVASFEYNGVGYDKDLSFKCGTLTKNIHIYDALLYLRNGTVETARDMVFMGTGNSVTEWVNTGLKVSSATETSQNATGKSTTTNVNSRYMLSWGKVEEDGTITVLNGSELFREGCTFEFTWKGGSGVVPLNVRVYNSITQSITETNFTFGAGKTKYYIITNQGVNRKFDGQVQVGDKFKLYFIDGNVLIYCNNVLLTSDSFDKSDEILFALFNLSGEYGIYQDIKVSALPPDAEVPFASKVSLSADKNVMIKNNNLVLTANVKTKNNNPVVGETITFYNGTTKLGTAITNNDGVATYTYKPTAKANLVLTAKSSNNKTSSAVSVRVKDNNNVANVVFSANPNPAVVDETITFTAKVTDSDGDPVKDKTVTWQMSTGVTDENGECTFPTTMTIDKTGTVEIGTCSCEGINSNNLTITVTANIDEPKNILLTGDKSILSYYDEDKCVLSASVADGYTPVSGETVSFYNGETLLGTGVTDSEGVATYTYNSQAAGDVLFKATVRNLVSETYSIEDCIYAEIGQIDITRTNNNDYYLLNGESISNLPSLYKIEFDMKTSNMATNGAEQRIYWTPSTLWTGNAQPSEAILIGYCYPSKYEGGKRLAGKTSSKVDGTASVNTWDSIRLEKVDDSSAFYIYLNNEYFTWYTLNNAKNYSDWIFGLALWSNTTYSIRNIKIKPL